REIVRILTLLAARLRRLMGNSLGRSRMHRRSRHRATYRRLPMDDIPHDQSPVDFTTAYEANLTAWIPIFGQLGRTYMDNPAGTKRSIRDNPSALFNSVMDAHLALEHVDAAIQIIVADAQARNVPLLWWIGSSTRPTNLGAHL